MPKVLVIGGGFAGAYAARRLARKGGGRVDVELVDIKNYFVFQPFLPEVAGGSVNVLDSVTPLRQMLKGVRVRTGVVRGIDLANRRVQVIQGEMGDVVEIGYDHLVMAFGQVVDLRRFPGMPEHAFTVKEAADSFALRNHIIDCLERASISGDADERRRLLTFVVVGAGLSGIEAMGEMLELLWRGLRFYPGISWQELRFVQIEFQKRILTEIDPALAGYAEALLRKRGVELVLGHGVRSAAAGSVELDDGTILQTATVVATLGNAPSPLARSLPVRLERGRVVVDERLRVRDHDNVWCIGDAAWVPLGEGRAAPPTAQAAVQEARTLADNLLATLAGRPLKPFSFRYRGTLVSLGGRKAVAELYGIKVSGSAAWLLWRLAYLSMLPVFSTRLRVAVDQFFDLFLPRNIVQTQQPPQVATRFVRHRKGDVVVRSGQMGEGVHLVLEGCYETVPNDGAGQVFGPGDHFGDEAVLEQRANDRVIRACEDSMCFILSRDAYRRLHQAFRPQRRGKLEDTFQTGLPLESSREAARRTENGGGG